MQRFVVLVWRKQRFARKSLSLSWAKKGAEAAFHKDPATTSIPEAPDPDSSAATARGAWQMEVSPGLWETVSSDVNMTLTEACHSGQLVVLYSVRGARPSEDASYDVDFRTLLQTNRKTGEGPTAPLGSDCLGSRSGSRSGSPSSRSGSPCRSSDEISVGAQGRALGRLRRGGGAVHRASLDAWSGLHSIRSLGVSSTRSNFPRMVQINLSTGNKRHIRVKPVGTHYAEVPQPYAGQDEPEKLKEPENARTEEATAKATTEPRQAHSKARSVPEKKRFSLGKKARRHRMQGTQRRTQSQASGAYRS